MKNKAAPQGFTLIELLVYMTILAIFLTSTIQFTSSVVRAGEKARILNEVQQNARFAMERMRREIRTADGLIVDDSTFGSHPGVLSLEHDAVENDPTVFHVENGALKITQGEGSALPLTSSKVEVSNFVVYDRSVDDRTRNVQMQLTLRWAGPTANVFDTSISLQSTTVIREEED